MTVLEVVGRLEQIQSTLNQLSAVSEPSTNVAGRVSTASVSTASISAFAKALALTSSSVGLGYGSGPRPAVTGTDVTATAMKYLGVPYVFGGADARGLDCSGLVQRVFGDLGVEMPRLVSEQKTMGTEVPSLAEAKPGDLIVTRGGDHILIYAGDNKVIQAPYPGRNVSIVDQYLTDADIATIRRIVPAAATWPVLPPSAGSTGDLVQAAQLAAVAGWSK